LVLGKINESDATRCQISRLKCTKLDIRWGSAPDTAGGAYSAPPDTLAVFKGRTSKVGRGREGNGREREERGEAPRYFGLEWPVGGCGSFAGRSEVRLGSSRSADAARG